MFLFARSSSIVVTAPHFIYSIGTNVLSYLGVFTLRQKYIICITVGIGSVPIEGTELIPAVIQMDIIITFSPHVFFTTILEAHQWKSYLMQQLMNTLRIHLAVVIDLITIRVRRIRQSENNIAIKIEEKFGPLRSNCHTR